MIKTDFHKITLRDYNQCLKGNTSVLLKIKLPFKLLKNKTDMAFLDISERLSVELENNGTSFVIKMHDKIKRRALKLRILTLLYNVLMLKKDETALKMAKKYNFTWSEKLSYEDNLRVLAGIIDRINNDLLQENKRYEKIVNKTEKDSQNHNLSDIVASLNYISNSNLSMDSSLEDFISVNKLSKEIIKMNKKNA